VIFPSIAFSNEGHVTKQGLPEKIAVLKMLSLQTKANYDKIRTWAGSYSYREQWRLVGDEFKTLCNEAKISPSANQLPVISVSCVTARFAVDFAKDSLFSAFEADRPAEVRLQTGELIKVPNVIATKVMSISTPEHYLNFMPNVNHMALPDYPKVAINDGVGRMAFREPSRNGKMMPWGTIFDPRFLFSFEVTLVHAWLDNFCVFTANATLDQRKELDNSLDVKEEHSGDNSIYTIVFGRSEEKELTFDGKVGFNLVKFVAKDRSNRRHRWEETWEYQKVDDVYIPANVQFVEYKSAVLDRTVVLRECSINKPIAPTVFTYDQFGLKNGERVLDKIEGALFVYHDGKLIPAKDMPPPQGKNISVNTLPSRRWSLTICSIALVVCMSIFVLRRWRKQIR
jgi:hypothetical protein